jgi:hypothetical protein
MRRACIICDKNMLKGVELLGDYWIHEKCKHKAIIQFWVCEHGFKHPIDDSKHSCDKCCSKLSDPMYKITRGNTWNH